MVETILLPVDGSDPSQRAIEQALEIAARDDATIQALFVVDTREMGEPALSSTEVLISEYEDKGHDLLGEIFEAGRDRGVEVETTCRHGDPTEEILEAADRHDADVIVMGLRGETHTRLPGSVTSTVVREHDDVIVAE